MAQNTKFRSLIDGALRYLPPVSDAKKILKEICLGLVGATGITIGLQAIGTYREYLQFGETTRMNDETIRMHDETIKMHKEIVRMNDETIRMNDWKIQQELAKEEPKDMKRSFFFF